MVSVKVNWGKYQLTDELFPVREYNNEKGRKENGRFSRFCWESKQLEEKRKLIFDKNYTGK